MSLVINQFFLGINERGSPKFTVRRIAALSLVSLWLAGCSDTSNPPAPVSSVNGNAPANTNSGMLITPPPKMGTTSTAQQPQIQPVQQPQIQATQQPQIQPVQPVAQQPVQMENGRIVYNRQYGNIPKGSYSGSTYTVKKATRFSISPGLLATISVTLLSATIFRHHTR